MRRPISYIGQTVYDWLFTRPAQDNMVALGKLAAAVLGTSTLANGLAVTPTAPASLQVNVAPGEIYSLAALEATAYGSLAADTTHQIVKQGISLDTVPLTINPPGTAGQSINYLVQATFAEQDISVDPTSGNTPVVLQFYNSSNPQVPWSGPGGNGQSSNTFRQGSVVLTAKAGIAATTGSQVTPAPDAGNIGLYVVTVANGQSTITSGNIALYAGAPIIGETLTQKISQATADSRYVQASVVGCMQSFRNLAASATGTGASVTITADQIVTTDGAGNFQSLASWSGSINTGTVGPGGLDTGTVAANTWYFGYAISKPDGTKSFIGSLSSSGPSLANAAGYTKWSLVTAFRSDGTANKFPLSYIQAGRLWQYKVAAGSNVTAVPSMASISSNSMTAIAVGAYVPTAIASAIEVLGSAISNNALMVAPNSAWSTATSAAPTPKSTNAATAAVTDSTIKVRMVLESTNIYAAVTGGSGSVWCAGWELNV